MLSKSSKDNAFSFITKRRIFSSFSTYCKEKKRYPYSLSVDRQPPWLLKKHQEIIMKISASNLLKTKDSTVGVITTTDSCPTESSKLKAVGDKVYRQSPETSRPGITGPQITKFW